MAKSLYVRSSYETCATPQFKVMSQDQSESVFNGALEILAHTGADVESQEALEVFRQGGCWVDGTRVRFPSWLVERAVRSAPSRITIYNRQGKRSMFLEGYNVYYGPGSGNAFIIDPFTGERRRPRKEDTAVTARVADALGNIDFVMANGVPADEPPCLAGVRAFQAMLTNTSKPIVHGGVGVKHCQEIVDMAAAVSGGLSALQQHPFIILYCEAGALLHHATATIDKAIFAAKSNIPYVYAPCVYAGGNAPGALAGSLVIAVADALVGLVAGQLVREGSPFIFGGPISVMDISSSVMAYGAPELSLLSGALTSVAHCMKVPMFSTAGCSDSKLMDAQVTLEAAFSIFMASLSGANLIHGCNCLEGGVTGAVELMVVDDEIAGEIKHYLRGIEVDDDTLAVDVIDHVGPGGHFLGEEHTVSRFRKEFWWPTVISRMRYDEWHLHGDKTLGQRVKEKTQRIINEHRPEALPQQILDQIQAVIDRADAR